VGDGIGVDVATSVGGSVGVGAVVAAMVGTVAVCLGLSLSFRKKRAKRAIAPEKYGDKTTIEKRTTAPTSLLVVVKE